MERVNNSMLIFFLDKNYPVPPAVRKRGRSEDATKKPEDSSDNSPVRKKPDSPNIDMSIEEKNESHLKKSACK